MAQPEQWLSYGTAEQWLSYGTARTNDRAPHCTIPSHLLLLPLGS